jgi:hypothetical protein
VQDYKQQDLLLVGTAVPDVTNTTEEYDGSAWTPGGLNTQELILVMVQEYKQQL